MPVQELPLEGQQRASDPEGSEAFLLHEFEAADRMRKSVGKQIDAADRSRKEDREQIRKADELRMAAIALVKAQVDLSHGFPEFISRCWGDLCASVIDGRTSEAQEERAQFDARVTMAVSLAKRAKRSADLAAKFGENIPRAEELQDVITQLSRFQDSVLSRWHSAEDLEDLVAEQTAPSAAEFDAVAQRFGPPTEWIQHCGESPSSLP